MDYKWTIGTLQSKTTSSVKQCWQLHGYMKFVECSDGFNPFSTKNFPAKIFEQKFLFFCNFWTYINFLLDQNSRNITSLWSNILKFSKMFIKIKFLYYFIVVSRNERVNPWFLYTSIKDVITFLFLSISINDQNKWFVIFFSIS